MPSNRVRPLAVVALALAVAGGAILVSASGGSRPTTPAADDPVFAGIPERRGVLGDRDAPVTVTEFVDLQCPVCAAVADEVLPTLVRDYVRTGRVKLELRTLYFLGADSELAARAAAGAERQGRLWPFVEAFYGRQGTENSGYVTDGFLREVAAASGVDADAMLDGVVGPFAQRRLDRADADAARLGVTGTPTFAVARRGEAPVLVDAGSLVATLARETAR